MYSTEYDLLVAADRFRELEAQMREINNARAIMAQTPGRPSLLDRLVALIHIPGFGQTQKGAMTPAA
jgi:hypothetical protein